MQKKSHSNLSRNFRAMISWPAAWSVGLACLLLFFGNLGWYQVDNMLKHSTLRTAIEQATLECVKQAAITLSRLNAYNTSQMRGKSLADYGCAMKPCIPETRTIPAGIPTIGNGSMVDNNILVGVYAGMTGHKKIDLATASIPNSLSFADFTLDPRLTYCTWQLVGEGECCNVTDGQSLSGGQVACCVCHVGGKRVSYPFGYFGRVLWHLMQYAFRNISATAVAYVTPTGYRHELIGKVEGSARCFNYLPPSPQLPPTNIVPCTPPNCPVCIEPNDPACPPKCDPRCECCTPGSPGCFVPNCVCPRKMSPNCNTGCDIRCFNANYYQANQTTCNQWPNCKPACPYDEGCDVPCPDICKQAGSTPQTTFTTANNQVMTCADVMDSDPDCHPPDQPTCEEPMRSSCQDPAVYEMQKDDCDRAGGDCHPTCPSECKDNNATPDTSVTVNGKQYKCSNWSQVPDCTPGGTTGDCEVYSVTYADQQNWAQNSFLDLLDKMASKNTVSNCKDSGKRTPKGALICTCKVNNSQFDTPLAANLGAGGSQNSDDSCTNNTAMGRYVAFHQLSMKARNTTSSSFGGSNTAQGYTIFYDADGNELARQQAGTDVNNMKYNGQAIDSKCMAFTPVSFIWDNIKPKLTATMFPINPNQIGKWFHWLASPSHPLLVYDPQHTGIISSASQLFGNYTFGKQWDNGYEAMAYLDINHDGKLNKQELKDLALWFDAGQDGISHIHEVIPVSQLQITEIYLKPDKYDLLTNDIFANIGYKRVINGKEVINGSFDWSAKGGYDTRDIALRDTRERYSALWCAGRNNINRGQKLI